MGACKKFVDLSAVAIFVSIIWICLLGWNFYIFCVICKLVVSVLVVLYSVFVVRAMVVNILQTEVEI